MSESSGEQREATRGKGITRQEQLYHVQEEQDQCAGVEGTEE